MIRLNIIGAGKVGQTLGKLWAQQQLVTITSVCNRTITSAQNAVAFFGTGLVAPTLHDLEPADLYLITTVDDAICSIAQTLAFLESIPPNAVIIHCSGYLSSKVLRVLRERNCYVASVHPVKSFADIQQSITTFKGTYCAYEGDWPARAILLSLFQEIGGILFDIDETNKAIYHAAGVFANNYLVTLAHAAIACYDLAHVPREVAKALVIQLMQNAINNIQHKTTLLEALTGPIKRGDVNTILGHMDALAESSLQDLYRLLGKETTVLVEHPAELTKQIQSIWQIDFS